MYHRGGFRNFLRGGEGSTINFGFQGAGKPPPPSKSANVHIYIPRFSSPGNSWYWFFFKLNNVNIFKTKFKLYCSSCRPGTTYVMLFYTLYIHDLPETCLHLYVCGAIPADVIWNYPAVVIWNYTRGSIHTDIQYQHKL